MHHKEEEEDTRHKKFYFRQVTCTRNIFLCWFIHYLLHTLPPHSQRHTHSTHTHTHTYTRARLCTHIKQQISVKSYKNKKTEEEEERQQQEQQQQHELHQHLEVHYIEASLPWEACTRRS